LQRLGHVLFRLKRIVLFEEALNGLVEVVLAPLVPVHKELEHYVAGHSLLFTLEIPQKETVTHGNGAFVDDVGEEVTLEGLELGEAFHLPEMDEDLLIAGDDLLGEKLGHLFLNHSLQQEVLFAIVELLGRKDRQVILIEAIFLVSCQIIDQRGPFVIRYLELMVGELALKL
jgi:hypothetical protein